MKRLTLNKLILSLLSLAMFAVAISIVCLLIGENVYGINELYSAITESDSSENLASIILLDVRLPRVFLAFVVGFVLSVAGVIFQALLRNPLAEPHLLGVSSGSALGAVIGAIFLSSFSFSFIFGLPIFAFVGAFLSISFIYAISLRKKVLSVYTLLLVGVIMNSFFVSVIVFIQSIVSADELLSIFSWLLGSFAYVNKELLGFVSCFSLLSVFISFFFCKHLNLISLGERRAQSMGLEVEKTKKICFLLASVMTGLIVSVSGLIGFVGLVVPHIARLMFGQDHRLVLPASGLIGATLLVVSDTIARTLIAPQEIPVGVITSFLGAPFFIFLLRKQESRNIF